VSLDTRSGHGSGFDSGRILRFLSDPESKICEKRTRSHFSISAVAGVCVVISQVKTWVNFGWNDGSRSLNRSRILKFVIFPYPDPNSKILEQERSRSLKKWLRPPLLDTTLGYFLRSTGRLAGTKRNFAANAVCRWTTWT